MEMYQHFSRLSLSRLLKRLNDILRTPMIFLRKLDAFPSLPEDIILCTIDVAGLYPFKMGW